MHLNLDADGNGESPSLPEALTIMPLDGTLYLEAGTYYLQEPLVLSRSISIIGAGPEQRTTIAITNGNGVLYFQGPGSIHLEGVTFRFDGNQSSSVVGLKDATFSVLECDFLGARSDGGSQSSGSGLHISGTSSGSVRNSFSSSNQRNGISVNDQSNVLLEQNEFSV